MSESVLLTDSSLESLEQALPRLDGWGVERVPSDKLADSVATCTGARAVLVESNDPAILRTVVERAHSCGIP
ncbi:MAG TPA: hypothetical protein VIP11_07505, partial [Gemmatimonadaceae bacterium]